MGSGRLPFFNRSKVVKVTAERMKKPEATDEEIKQEMIYTCKSLYNSNWYPGDGMPLIKSIRSQMKKAAKNG